MKKFLITEEEKNNIRTMYESKIITEQLSLLSIAPVKIDISQGNNTKQILLKSIDPNTKKPLVLRYNIQGKYSGFDFDVQMRGIKRNKYDGSLNAEVLPDNKKVQWLLRTLMPEKLQSDDGWLFVTVTADKLNQAIDELKKNKGVIAKIDAGYGVKVLLSYAK